MPPSKPTSNTAPQNRKHNTFLIAILLPAASCMLSSLVGILLGQVGNLLYAAVGQMSACLTVPGFFFLFGISFGLSFLFNKLLQRLLSGRKEKPVPQKSI